MTYVFENDVVISPKMEIQRYDDSPDEWVMVRDHATDILLMCYISRGSPKL